MLQPPLCGLIDNICNQQQPHIPSTRLHFVSVSPPDGWFCYHAPAPLLCTTYAPPDKLVGRADPAELRIGIQWRSGELVYVCIYLSHSLSECYMPSYYFQVEFPLFLLCLWSACMRGLCTSYVPEKARPTRSL